MANTFHIGAVVRKDRWKLIPTNGWTLHPECGSKPGIAAHETNMILESGTATAVPLGQWR